MSQPSSRSVRPRPRSTWRVVLVLVLALAACSASTSRRPRPDITPGPYSAKPNIVYVLTDDLSMNLVRFMPHVIALQQQGMTFTNYTVTDSLCCPSRASILTGRFPHNTHVYSNTPPDGGFEAFRARNEGKDTFAVALQKGGYRTALMGKYLNGYQVRDNSVGQTPDYIPPGWSRWVGAGFAYREYNYRLNENHQIVSFGDKPGDYLTTVLDKFGNDFISSSVAARKPFFLQMSTFSPHSPYTPAPADDGTFNGLKAPRTSSFDRKPLHAPEWLASRPALNRTEIATIDRAYEKRVEAVQSVDRMIGALEATLRRTVQLANTYFVFNSDNGYHMGEHGLGRGKLTAFDTDIRVPLIVVGPRIVAGSTNANVVENIDLAPTFEQLAGVPTPDIVDGESVVPLLHGQKVDWRTLALVEHRRPDVMPGDPDQQTVVDGTPPTYDALRSTSFTYIRYADGEREYYNRVTDPEQNDNIIAKVSPARLAQLNRTLDRLTACMGAVACTAAAKTTSA